MGYRGLSGQSAIEYLMTYGWMLLVVAIVGGSVFSVFNQENLETVSGFQGDDVLVDNFGTTNEGELQMVLRNGGAERIEVQEVKVRDESGNEAVWEPAGEIRELEVGDEEVATFLQIQEGDSANNLDIELTYDVGGLENLQSEGTLTGSFEILEESVFLDMNPLVLHVNSTENGGTDDDEFEIPARGNMNYQVWWENLDTGEGGEVIDPLTEDYTLAFDEPGNYRVEIRGILSHLRFSSGVDENKVESLEAWGDISWTSMNGAFRGTSNMEANYEDTPDTSRVTDLQSVFRSSSFNGDVSGWDTSNVGRMDNSFRGASEFEGDGIEDWDVSSVTRMLRTFNGASSFNGDVSEWDVSNVGETSSAMHRMFHGAEEFDQDISSWNTSKVDNMTWMFRSSTFDRDITEWCVEKIDEEPSRFGVSEENQPDWGEPC